MTGKELKIRREELDYTQAELAEILGVASNTVARWEQGVMDVPKAIELAVKSVPKSKATKKVKQ